jgi:ubiquitin-protein ligase
MGSEGNVRVRVESALGLRTTNEFDLDETQTVQQVLEEIGVVQAYDSARMTLIKGDKELPRDRTLKSLGVSSGDVLRVIPRDTVGGSDAPLAGVTTRRLQAEAEEAYRKKLDLRPVEPRLWRGGFRGAGPWAGQRIPVEFEVPETFPDDAPRVRVLAPMRPKHPNISDEGIVCLSILKKDWHPTYTLSTVLEALTFLTANPNYHHPFTRNAPPGDASWISRFFRGA